MKAFDIESYLKDIYSAFPEADKQPVIGITTNYSEPDANVRDRYYQQVIKAGGTPILIPPTSDKNVLINSLNLIDGLILTGGADMNPLWFGEEPAQELQHINATRDLPELLLTRLARNRQIPILGICRGLQVLTVTFGGKVVQDIYRDSKNQTDSKNNTLLIKHLQDADKSEPTHTVHIIPGTLLEKIYADDASENETGTANTTAPTPISIAVNSFHHQAVSSSGPHLRVSATAPDGVIEAVESTEHQSVIGVQWHPEWLGEQGQPLFRWLVRSAEEFAAAKNLHQRILTLDTHCDTPMFFPRGVQFGQRDSRILYDLHKMTDGRQDAVIMVAYLPQPKPGEAFAQNIDIAGLVRHHPELRHITAHLAPDEYAHLIFDRIERIAGQYQAYIRIARTPAELYQNKQEGRKSVMLGIENGLALNHDTANVHRFAERGVVYITLCHNGDNDICDSARRSNNTHNGVSPFGAEVIREMNKEGIMVDLSHGGEKSFYDALDISSTPIVCSHSNSRALCDVSRNLTDDQLCALAQKGGVAHVTLYPGFLRTSGEASVLDAIEHLEHFIAVMGIDHVGIGTDFDGDGGVNGCADASELINFTIALLRRKYSESDIEKIWGGNWLRVMKEVQALKQQI